MNPPSRLFRSFAVIPAAGRSTRMGQPKLLLPWRGATLIEAQLQVWRASPVDAVVVVVHPDDRQLAQVCQQAGAEVVIPASAPEEMKTSVNHALRRISECWSPLDGDAWLLAPADMPLLKPCVIEQLLKSHDPCNPRIIVPGTAGRGGHPVLFPWRLAAEASRLGKKEGINALQSRHATQQLELADDGMFSDVDTPEDYRRLLEVPQSTERVDGDAPIP